MKQIGMTNVARWMTERLPNGVTAYMEYAGKLFRLKRVTSYNGSIRPVFATLLQANRGSEFIGPSGPWTLESPVFLTLDRELAGVVLADVIDSVEPANPGCWALRGGAVRDNVAYNCLSRQQEAPDQATASAAGAPCWYG